MLSEKVQQEREVRHRVMAAMETGNHADARMVLHEVQDLTFSIELQLDVLDSYGILL